MTSPVVTTYLDAATVVADFIASPAVAASWDQPSALPKMSVGGLAGHLARQVLNTPGLLRQDPVGEPPVSLIEHYQRSAWVGTPLDDPVNVGIRESGENLGTDGAIVVSKQVRDAIVELRAALPGLPPDRLVWLAWAGWNLTLEDYLSTRLLEIVVHTDDLAFSVDTSSGPGLPAAATDATLTLLTRLAVRRHGVTPVLRALSRQERAPESIAAI